MDIQNPEKIRHVFCDIKQNKYMLPFQGREVLPEINKISDKT